MSNHPIIKALQEELAEERNDEMTAFELCTGPVGYRIGHSSATARLLPLIEKMIKVIKFYGNENNWDEIWVDGDGLEEDGGDCSCRIDWHDVEIKKDEDGTIYYATGGKKAREFLTTMASLKLL